MCTHRPLSSPARHPQKCFRSDHWSDFGARDLHIDSGGRWAPSRVQNFATDGGYDWRAFVFGLRYALLFHASDLMNVLLMACVICQNLSTQSRMLFVYFQAYN